MDSENKYDEGVEPKSMMAKTAGSNQHYYVHNTKYVKKCGFCVARSHTRISHRGCTE